MELADEVARLLDRAGLTGAIPVPVADLARFMGFDIVPWAGCPATVSGLLWRGEYGTEIILNATKPKTRQRFTIAHECAHGFYEDPGSLFTYCQDDPWQPEEIRASQFAAEVLVPTADLAVALDGLTPADIGTTIFTALCATYAVSKQMMTRRIARFWGEREGWDPDSF